MAIEYSAATLECTTCSRRWRAVYQLHSAGDRPPGDGHVENCAACGAPGRILNPAWVIPSPRANQVSELRP